MVINWIVRRYISLSGICFGFFRLLHIFGIFFSLFFAIRFHFFHSRGFFLSLSPYLFGALCCSSITLSSLRVYVLFPHFLCVCVVKFVVSVVVATTVFWTFFRIRDVCFSFLFCLIYDGLVNVNVNVDVCIRFGMCMRLCVCTKEFFFVKCFICNSYIFVWYIRTCVCVWTHADTSVLSIHNFWFSHIADMLVIGCGVWEFEGARAQTHTHTQHVSVVPHTYHSSRLLLLLLFHFISFQIAAFFSFDVYLFL